MATTRRLRSPMLIGDRSLSLTASTSEARYGSTWRRRSRSLTDVSAGSARVRKTPKCFNRVAIVDTVVRSQVARLRSR